MIVASKGFWAVKLGVGDFYYELGVQIVEICIATSHLNGGEFKGIRKPGRVLESMYLNIEILVVCTLWKCHS